MTTTATCRHCGRRLRVDCRPGEQPEPDMGPQHDCPWCEVERRKLTTADVVRARIVPRWAQLPEEWEP